MPNYSNYDPIPNPNLPIGFDRATTNHLSSMAQAAFSRALTQQNIETFARATEQLQRTLDRINLPTESELARLATGAEEISRVLSKVDLTPIFQKMATVNLPPIRQMPINTASSSSTIQPVTEHEDEASKPLSIQDERARIREIIVDVLSDIAADLPSDAPPGTLAGIRELLRQSRNDRELDKETRAFLIRIENKMDRVIEYIEWEEE